MPGSRSTSTAYKLSLESIKTGQLSNSVNREDYKSTHPRHILPHAGLVVVDVNPLELQVGLAGVGAGGVDPVLVTGGHKNTLHHKPTRVNQDQPDNLPELGSDLVAALAGLHVHDFPHGGGRSGLWK